MAFSLLGFFCLWRDLRPLAFVCALLALCVTGSLTELLHRPGAPPFIDSDSRSTLIVSGCVVEPPVFFVDKEQFTLELEKGARARVNLFLREGEAAPLLRYGQRVEFDAKLRTTRNFGNPGAFDYAGYLARRNIYWTASTRAGARIQVLPGSCGSRFESIIFRMRTAALDRLDRLYGSKPYDTAMMQAILIGESSKLEKVWTEEFRSTGTFHALVISGTHVAVLATLLLFLLRICFVPQMLALTATVAASWLYALVTGWQAPVIRSAAGLSLYLVARYFYRRGRVMNLLAAVAIAFLILDPPQLFDPSFQLSFLSVGFLGAIAVPLIERTSGPMTRGLSFLAEEDRDRRLAPAVAQFRVELRLLAETVQLWLRLPKRIALQAIAIPARLLLFIFELVLTSAVIQMGLALPMAIYFHRISISGLSANAIIIPLMGLVVPVGFVAIATGWTLPAKAAGLLLAGSQWAAHWHAGWEPNWRIPSPPLWLAISLAASLIWLGLTQNALRRYQIASFCVVLALLSLVLWHPFAPLVQRRSLEVTAIDVGQGDSIFVAFPDGKLMLMDGGGIPSFGRRTKSRMDIGEDVVSPYLWGRSIRRIDIVALSHAHEDHIGGLGAILENFHVRELWIGAMPDSPAWDALREKALRHQVKIVSLSSRNSFDFGGVAIQVLAPRPDYAPSSSPKNNDSLALRFQYGQRSFLLTGDIERQVEAELVSEHLLGTIDVLKVAHHGSKTSTTLAMLEAAQPLFAVISAGFENSYGHPNPEILSRLDDRGIRVLRTDKSGLVSAITDGYRLKIETADGARSSGRATAIFGR